MDFLSMRFAFERWDICEELTLTTVAHRDQDTNPGSHGFSIPRESNLCLYVSQHPLITLSHGCL